MRVLVESFPHGESQHERLFDTMGKIRSKYRLLASQLRLSNVRYGSGNNQPSSECHF